MRIILLIAVLTAAISCRKQQSGSLEGQVFNYLVVPDEASCNQIQQMYPIFNCVHSITFEDDNKIKILWTDILFNGNYRQIGNMVFINFGDADDIPAKGMNMVLVNKNTLRDDYGLEWKRWKGPSAWDLY